MGDNIHNPRCVCGASAFEPVYDYDRPPAGEVRFNLERESGYRRQVVRCIYCGHFLSLTQMDLSALYDQDYVDSTYGGAQGMRRTFDKIINLPQGKSDNKDRVKRILQYAARHTESGGSGRRRLLDIGSGLCVFPYEMKRAGWDCMALDTDPRQAEHARECAGVGVVCQEFGPGLDLGRFDLITFNKVLEHIKDPAELLLAAKDYLHPKGFVYVELPDGQAASRDSDGPQREEFFIEHHHIFSPASAAILVSSCGFALRELECLREPSSKYTLRLFITPDEAI